MDSGAFLAVLALPLALGLIIGLIIGAGFLAFAVVAAANYGLTKAVGATVDSLRARHRKRRN